ncbi:mechanosensitive ion channel family protein [Tessaracoccus flavus]|uniref:Small-conductance mechanosensitive ion channel n=1 Tax=Tessaracoccus flavus TaxID=1610493 RepID=A0A1Q2CGY9_9ACTN|nr:mechanosensitive ion channel domain-containing protein [Tessaracoccus flavus]AQP45382.1 small-conductance mechanosensitive ion channel [Tessaracoccus flavus]SDY93601.1 Mechanosensitive ion channel [Tessaracoccus flavus]
MIDLPPITWQMVLTGLAVVLAGILVSYVARFLAARLLSLRDRSPSSVRVFSQVIQVVIIILTVAAAMTVVFPSVKPVDVLGGITIISLAAGIAFQTVLGNMFAGMVILARDRFRVGDQIRIFDHAGTVSEMGLSHTSLRTFDGRLVVIPNSALHSELVTVQTGYERVRSTVNVDLDDAVDLGKAREVALEAMKCIPSVLEDPAPDALLREIGTATVRMELRFWSGARQLETRTAQDAVIQSVVEAFRTHDVKSGDEVVTVKLVSGVPGAPQTPAG